MLAKDKVLKGRYRIVERLGQSETSAVYEAYDSVRKTNVALKEILIDSEKVPAINQREMLKRSFSERAKILAEVKHESLPQVRGYFSEFDRQYLVMELIDGDDAGKLLDKNKTALALTDIANWADQLLDALDYLHTLAPPIVHGDVKPSNVKLTSRGRIKLLGFDITESADEKVKTIVTNQNSVTATLPYLPLEQLLQTADLISEEDKRNYREKLDKVLMQTADARSDVYALGATIYHLLTAQPPIDALERSLAVWAEEFDPLPSANELNPSIPIEISEVLVKALEIEPEKRLGSAMEMRQALQTAVLRAKERETAAAKNKEEAAVRESLLAEEKRLEQQRQIVEQERLKLEAEQKQQKELIERQLKEAEAERLKAEQRAAEAEKRLLEEAKKAAEQKMAESVTSANAPYKSSISTEDFSTGKKSLPSFGDSRDLFAAPKSNKKTSLLVPAVIVLFLLIGGAAAGIWMFQSSNKVEANQTNTGQTNPSADKATFQPSSETSAPPTAEKISTTNAMPVAPVVAEKTNQPAAKNKPAPAPATRVEKPAAPKPAKQKKAVTVDDIIGGN